MTIEMCSEDVDGCACIFPKGHEDFCHCVHVGEIEELTEEPFADKE